MDRIAEHYDAIVVGTGPGGGVVARDLTRQGKNVLVIERGDYQPIRGTLTQMVSRGWYPAVQMPITTQLKPVVRGITTGGTGMLYMASAKTIAEQNMRPYSKNSLKS